jgi:hypothetical protein
MSLSHQIDKAMASGVAMVIPLTCFSLAGKSTAHCVQSTQNQKLVIRRRHDALEECRQPLLREKWAWRFEMPSVTNLGLETGCGQALAGPGSRSISNHASADALIDSR